MKKIRINELARELEVKPGVLIDILHDDMGIEERKTHSSSIEDDLADELRRRLQKGAKPAPAPRKAQAEPAEAEEPARTQSAVAPSRAQQAAPPQPPPQAQSAPADRPSSPPVQAKDAKPGHSDDKEALAELPPGHARAVPIRPPLASPGASRPVVPPIVHHAPAIPIPPRTVAHQPPPPAPKPTKPVAPAQPPAQAAAPASPGRPEAPRPAPQAPPARPAPQAPPPARTISRTTPIAQQPMPAAPPKPAAPAAADSTPSRPTPEAPTPRPPAPPRPPKPGQIISGPRQPLPGGEMPRPPIVSPGRPRPDAPSPRGPAAPRIPQPPVHSTQPPQRSNLVGQPASRPVVPPRPDLVARLQAQSQPRSMPGQPSPRPGAPMPGQPIYQGPRRSGPGQPSPRPGGRGRGPHPVSPVLVPPPPVEVGRRDSGRKRATQRRREEIEGRLRHVPSRREVVIPKAVHTEINISEGITVKEFSEKLGIKAALVIKQLVDRKIFATINQTLDVKLAQELAKVFGAEATQMSYEEESTQVVSLTEVEGDRFPRPPVVTVMGHVDHGKTSLLDAIRETNVAAREAGGITQHIGAYHVEINDRKIVFIDTPGHEAFTRMRARGAKVTDIVILVVAADDGVMPQTREAIDHARAAGVPIIVAVNKIDKAEAQIDRVKQQLNDLGLMPEDWGGDTPYVPVSAKQRQNIELLLEMIVLVADMQDLRGNPGRPAVASVLEAKLDRGRGPVATVLVRNGTLRTGDHVLCGSVFSRIRALMDDRGERVDEVGPSMPVEILGLDSLPDVGDDLQAVTDIAKARQIAEFRETKSREIAMARTRVSLEQFHAQLREGESKELNLILKADVGGTAEVLADTLQKLSTEKVSIRVISSGVGAISESDVNLASASNAIIVGFNVRPERKAAELAETEKVDTRLHTVIYELTDEIKKAMVGMLEPVFKEVFRGRADVRETFRISKVGTVAGCYVTEGNITRDCEVRLLRDNIVVHTGRVDALKRFKNDVSEVKQGFECGISLVNFHDIKPGDVFECFVKERVAQESLV